MSSIIKILQVKNTTLTENVSLLIHVESCFCSGEVRVWAEFGPEAEQCLNQKVEPEQHGGVCTHSCLLWWRSDSIKILQSWSSFLSMCRFAVSSLHVSLFSLFSAFLTDIRGSSVSLSRTDWKLRWNVFIWSILDKQMKQAGFIWCSLNCNHWARESRK